MHPFLLHYPVLFSNVSAGGAPDWVLRGGTVPANLDIDFVNDRVYGASSAAITSVLSCSRGSGGYYLNADGTLTWFASNTLRYGTNGLLVEEQRTNLCLRSQDFSNAAWAAFGTSCSKIGASAELAPDGTATVYEVDLGTDGGAIGSAGAIYQSISVTNGVTYAGSVYVRAKTGTTSCRISISSGAIDGSADVSLTTTWQRITVTHTATATVSGNIAIRNNVAGNSGRILVWGAQLEAGSFATSYIPTTSSSATRNADNITFASVAFLNPTTETWYAEANPSNIANYRSMISYGAANLDFYVDSGTGKTAADYNGGLNGTTTNAVTVGSAYKAAFAATTNDLAVCLNGGTVATDNLGSVPARPGAVSIGSLSAASEFYNGYIRRIAYWNSRVSNANLQTLTSYALTDSIFDIDFINNLAYTRSYLGQSTRSSVSISSLLTCTRSTGGYYTNSNGTLTWVASNTLRYGDQGLLVEQSSTNLHSYANDYTQAIWNPSANVTFTLAAAAAPDGTTTATSLIPTTATSSGKGMYDGLPGGSISSTAATFSIYAKANGYTQILFRENLSTGSSVGFTLSGSGSTTTPYTAGGCTITASITSLANGWYRCVATCSFAGATAMKPRWAVANGSYASGDANSFSWTPNGTSGIYCWGAQAENAAFATSPIITSGATAARSADNISMSLSPVAAYSVFAQTYSALGVSASRIIGTNGTSARAWLNANTNTQVASYNGSNDLAATIGSSGTFSANVVKSAVAGDATGRAIVANSGTVATDSNPITTSFTTIYMGSSAGTGNFLNGYIQRAAYITTRLGSTNLQTLTA